MQTLSRGVSRTSVVAVIVAIIIILVASIILVSRTSTPTAPTSSSISTSASSTNSTTSTSTTAVINKSVFTLSPPNSSELIDVAQYAPPGSLDPQTADFALNLPIDTAVFQELVEYNGSSISQVIPALASSYNVSGNYENYTFEIRSNVTFSNGDKLNAYDVWFSFVRVLFMGQEPSLSNYGELTANLSTVAQTGFILPWGIRHALAYATANPAVLTNSTLMNETLSTLLSNYNTSNPILQRLVTYRDQAYVVTGPMTFQVNLLVPYRYFLLDIAGAWGSIVDPSFVDAHGGVAGGVSNAYFDANGGPGTGPYMFKSVGPAYSTIVLIKNPNYWGRNYPNLPVILQPAKIPIIVVYTGLAHNDRVEQFVRDQAQISYVSVPFIGTMYSQYSYKQEVNFSSIFLNAGFQPAFFYISMNTQKYPTDNNNFRLAVVHAINYTEILQTLYTFDGIQLGQEYIGPLTPGYGKFYNPDNLPLYSDNISLAAHYLNLAGEQENFSVVMPNGTVLGNPNAPILGPQVITYITPITPFEQEELDIVVSNLAQIGLSFSLQGVEPAVLVSWTSPQVTPQYVDLGWIPDWPDPIFQQMAPAITPTSYIPAWVNVSWVNQLMSQLPFETNQTQQLQGVAELTNFTYWYAPYAWLPNPATYFFVQPYLKGFIYNEFTGYFYNAMYYQTYTG
jgi:peptide/nickel transport system substrate-binding protein